MKRLSKDALSQRDTITAQMRECFTAIEIAITTFNEALEKEWESVCEALAAYEVSIADAKGWCEEQAQAMNEYYDERSERWQESEPGQAYRAWINSFEHAYLEDIELEQPEPLSLDEGDQADILDDLQETPE